MCEGGSKTDLDNQLKTKCEFEKSADKMKTAALSPTIWSVHKNLQETLAQAELMAKEGKPPKIPSRQLLQYLVRMGSFTSVPALHEDTQDVDFEIPQHVSRESLLHRCLVELPGNSNPITRKFIANQTGSMTNSAAETEAKFSALSKITEDDCDAGFRESTSQPQVSITPPISLGNEDDDGLSEQGTQSEEPGTVGRFRILTWNILAQALAVEHDNFVGLPDGTLDWEARRLRILHEILLYDPDVICLQEVDHFNFIDGCLRPLGYRGVFCSKPDSPCIYLTNNNGPDGCALFFRHDKFDLISASSRIIEIWRIQSNQVCILANLRLRSTGQQVCVATTHLKARQGALLATMRNEQGKDVAEYLKSWGVSSKPLVLCGDFNAVPTEPVVSTIKNRLSVRSAYANLYEGKEPPYTTWKVRRDGEYCHTIDYIFYNKFCTVDSLLDLPTEEQVGPSRLPNLNYASDHVAIACDIRLNNNN